MSAIGLTTTKPYLNNREISLANALKYISNKDGVVKEAHKNLGLQLKSKEVYEQLLRTDVVPKPFNPSTTSIRQKS